MAVWNVARQPTKASGHIPVANSLRRTTINMTDTVSPNFQTPAINQAGLVRFADSIVPGEKLLKVPADPDPLPYGNCYWNADYVARTRGGSVIHGWLFHCWTPFVIEAMHHAIVDLEGGGLLDVTAKHPSVKDRTHSIFLVDRSVDIDLQRLPNITSRTYLLSDIQLTRDFKQAYEAKNAAERVMANLIYEAGYRCESQFDLAAGRPAAPGAPIPLNSPFLPAILGSQSTADAAKIRLGNAIAALWKRSRQ